MKVCVNELRGRLQEADSNTNKKLLQSAIADRNTLIKSGIVRDSSNPEVDKKSSSYMGHPRRQNPFNDDSFDRGSVSSDRDSIVQKKARTFLEMHEEFRQQIKEITQEWLNSHKNSVLEGLQNDSCA